MYNVDEKIRIKKGVRKCVLKKEKKMCLVKINFCQHFHLKVSVYILSLIDIGSTNNY